MASLPRIAVVVALCTACVADPTFPALPETANSVRNRSVRVRAATCLTSKSPAVGVDCIDTSKPVQDSIKVAGLRGVNGVPQTPVELDAAADPFKANFGKLFPYWTRIPVGYGCGASLQKLFPDRKQPHAVDDAKGNKVTNDAAFQFVELNDLLKAAVDAGSAPVWTAAYDLGDGDGACTYENGEQKGKPIADPAKYGQVVRQIMKYYDRELPTKTKAEKPCAAWAGKKEEDPERDYRWKCREMLFNVEFGRDPFGAGGYDAKNPAHKQAWLAAYKEFATQLRQEFPLPGNDVNIIGPSVKIKGLLEVDNSDKSNTSRSPIFDFIDFVVANKVKNGKGEDDRLPLTYLSFEVEARTPVEAKAIAKKISDYAANAGLKYEKYMAKSDGKIEVKNTEGKVTGHQSDGSEPIPLWVTELTFVPPTGKGALPKLLTDDPVRMSAYLGTFYAACKVLWQGLVTEATVGTAARLPTVDKSKATAQDVAKSAKDSPYFWFGTTGSKYPAPGNLKPAGWHGFWFNSGFLAGKQMLAVEHGPDPLKTGSDKALPSTEDSNMIVLATRETCTDELGKEIDCISQDAKFPAVTQGRRRMLRLLLVDLAVAVDDSTGKETLEHQMLVKVEQVPGDVKTVGYRSAYMDGTINTWKEFVFTEPGTLVDAQNGQFHVTKTVSVPSLHYFEFLY
jgi:hypothetical protein